MATLVITLDSPNKTEDIERIIESVKEAVEHAGFENVKVQYGDLDSLYEKVRKEFWQS